MAGPSNYIPVSDSYSPSLLEAIFNDDQPNLLADLSSNAPFSYSSLLSYNPLEAYIPPSATTLHVHTSLPGANVSHPSPRIQDSTPLITNQEISEAGPSRRPVKRCRNMAELMESTKPSPPRNPAPSPAETTTLFSKLAKITNPFSCGCCHVLREIIHTNGLHHQRLEIHGRIGMICHAVHHQNVQEGPSNLQMFDFSKKNTEEIKHFLTQYCIKQNASGYVLVPDPLSSYYEALSVGLEWTESHIDLFGSSVNVENISSKGKEPAVEDYLQDDNSPLQPSEMYKVRLEQQQRAATMTLKDFSDFFHLTLEETSKQINLSIGTIKKICRREGLKDWPHRSLAKLMRRVAALRNALPHQDPALREVTLEHINKRHQEMIDLCNGVVPIVARFT